MAGAAAPLPGRAATLALPLLVLAYLAAFAWRFADERLYADSGYYLAQVINTGGFRIEHGRWALALSQVLPLLGVKAGASMSALILLHSLNNVAWLGLCLLVAARGLKDATATAALAATHLIGLTHGLLCPIFELYYGVDLLILLLSARRSSCIRGPWRWPLLTLLFLGAVSAHAMALMLAVALLAAERIWEDRRDTLLLLSTMAAYLLFHGAHLSPYEKDSASFLLRATNGAALWSAMGPGSLLELAGYAARHYPDVTLFAAWAAIALLKAHRWRQAMLLIGFLYVLHALISLKLQGFLHDRYREQLNFGAVAWVLLMLLRNASSLRLPALLPHALLAALVFRMARAEWIAPHYEERTHRIEQAIGSARDAGISKGIIAGPRFFGPMHHAIDLSWSVPVESLLLSSKHGPQGTVSIITSEDASWPGAAGHLDQLVFRRWDIVAPGWLNPRYFSAPQGRYLPVTAEP